MRISLKAFKMTKVFYADTLTNPQYNMLDKMEHIYESLMLEKSIQPGDRVMIKTHFGLYGNTNHIRPVYVRKIVDLVKASGGLPFVAETIALGYGQGRPYGGRTVAPDYLESALKNGFSQGTIGAPIVFADGYWGIDTYDVPIDGKNIKSVPVASALLDCDKVILVTHAKFHMMGVAAALKNLGVGLVGKKGKAAVHSPAGLQIDQNDCLGSDCSECIRVCPTRCITVTETVKVNMDKCVQCGHCSSVCRSRANRKALSVSWSGEGIQARVVENAMGVVNSIGPEKFFFINLALDITEKCDCICVGYPRLMHDLGIFGSADPVAVDIAVLDKMRSATLNKESPAVGTFDSLVENSSKFFRHANELGFGTTQYELVPLSKEGPSESIH